MILLPAWSPPGLSLPVAEGPTPCDPSRGPPLPVLLTTLPRVPSFESLHSGVPSASRPAPSLPSGLAQAFFLIIEAARSSPVPVPAVRRYCALHKPEARPLACLPPCQSPRLAQELRVSVLLPQTENPTDPRGLPPSLTVARPGAGGWRPGAG